MGGTGQDLPLVAEVVTDVADGLLLVPLLVASALWALGHRRGDRRVEKAAALVVALSGMGCILAGVGTGLMAVVGRLAGVIGG